MAGWPKRALRSADVKRPGRAMAGGASWAAAAALITDVEAGELAGFQAYVAAQAAIPNRLDPFGA